MSALVDEERELHVSTCFELPTEFIEAASKNGLPTSWIQVMIDGKFNHPASGAFEITAADMAAWASDISARGARIPIDFDHDSAFGKTKAAGWYTGQTQTLAAGQARPDVRAGVAEQTELWAEVEWTPSGQTAITSQEYRYVSPEFGWFARDPATGKKVKRHQMAATALTNRPFLPGMSPVRLSDVTPEAKPSSAPAPDQGDTMDKTILAALGIAEDADEATILAAIKERDTKIADLEAKVIPDDTIRTLTESARKGEQAAKDLHDMKRDQLLSDAVRTGKLLPVQKDGYAALYDADPSGVTQLLSVTPEKSFKPVGTDGGDGAGPEAGEPGTVTIQGSEYPVDERSHKLHVGALEVLKEQGKTEDTATPAEYLAAATVAERKLA